MRRPHISSGRPLPSRKISVSTKNENEVLVQARRLFSKKARFFQNPERAYRVRRPHFWPPACLTMAIIFSGRLVRFANFCSEMVLSSTRGAHLSKMGLQKRPISDPFRPPFLELSRETSSHFEWKAPSQVEKN